MNLFKKLSSGMITAVVMTVLTFSALAAEPAQESVYIRQSGDGMCTLASATMVLRNAAYLSGEEDWELITEDAVRSSAWMEGVGLLWDFSYDGRRMIEEDVSGTDELKDLLAEHPEGIAAYDSSWPHAIFMTDYDEESGTFYCADPAEGTPVGRIPVNESLIRAEDVDMVWCLSEPVSMAKTEIAGQELQPEVKQQIEASLRSSTEPVKTVLPKNPQEEWHQGK